MIISAGYQKDIRNTYTPIDEKTEKELILKAQNGNVDARNAIVNSQLRQIINIAKAYTNAYTTIDDLIAYGVIGLDKAITMYETDSNVRLITYAMHWIRASMQEYALNNFTVRIPMNIIKEVSSEKQKNKVKKGSDEEAELNRKISVSFSMDSPIKEGEEATFADLIPSDLTTDKEFDNLEMVGKCLATLSDDDRKIIEMFFGLNDDEMTLESIGTQFGLTKQAISIRIKKALEKMQKKAK